MKNGFYHERPNDYDIYVTSSMVEEVKAKSINWHVTGNSFYGNDHEICAYVLWSGKRYVARLRGEWERNWTIYREA